ncbi:uncharacterized protein LOC122003962 [Zingiber officinale]|uniref:Uncharacterized protein n=1 Tax=Zingiber officinale TaxID=94328 RepID=A0A8J5HX96_ZINOF|nr:uncharacterized protein LOC122003962 [Zingiber officinale]KAG6537592.1 hypothetical protein ZIOFF_002686 [Zingiber officinale]
MATPWVKLLICKANAVDDVVAQPPAPSSSYSASGKKRLPAFLPPFLSCADSDDADVPGGPDLLKPKSEHDASDSLDSPALLELPRGHPSRRVVEVIFASNWAPGDGGFPGEVETVFRVRNTPRSVARFEAHRAAVRSRAARPDDARCAADGNEMMRFYCRRPSTSLRDAGVGGIRTFARSGEAHEASGSGRRAMLVCRVIAGRVRAESEPERAGESVSLGKGELLVFDPHAILPCFLIIYKI